MLNRKSFTKNQRLGILFLQKGRCAECGGAINLARGDVFEVDHLIPLALGGSNDWKNLRADHVDCHASKTKTDIVQITKAKRVNAKHNGQWRAPVRVMPGSKSHYLKKKINGAVVRRDPGGI